jgi:hypothetical protein
MILGKMKIPLVGGLKTGLLACWEFDNNCNDAASNYNLTAYNSPTYNSFIKKVGTYCAALDAASPNKYFGLTDSSFLNITTGPFSVSCWARADSTSTATIFNKGGSNAIGYFGQCYNYWTSVYALFCVRTQSVVCSSTIEFQYGQANFGHYVMTFSGTAGSSSTMKVYLNGILMDTRTANFSSASIGGTDLFKIGAWTSADAGPGLYVDQTAFWNRVLTAAEVSQLFNSYNGLLYTNWT